MSIRFGPCIQQGYVVPDIYPAIQHWLDRGVGPFFIEEHISPEGSFDGQAFSPDLSAAFAYSGDQQIEVIQQHDEQPSIYREFLSGNPAGGLQHLAFWVDDIDACLSHQEGRFTLRQRYGDMHAYVDSKKSPGVMIQLMQRSPMLLRLFETIKAGADGWDGQSDPIRSIDWSSGRPVISAVE